MRGLKLGKLFLKNRSLLIDLPLKETVKSFCYKTKESKIAHNPFFSSFRLSYTNNVGMVIYNYVILFFRFFYFFLLF